MKCSVIVANYNNGDFIEHTLRSIEQQVYTDWEVIIVDDGSSDNSLQVIEKYINSAPNKQKYNLLALSQNYGVGYAKRAGVKHSTGTLLTICDADDAFAPNALEEVVQGHITNPNASIVFSAHYNCDHTLTPFEVDPDSAPLVYSDILEDKISHLLSFKRRHYDLTPGFDPFFKLAVDKDIFYKLEEVGDVVFIDKPLYYYRISDRGISRGFEGFNKSREYKLVAINNAIARRKKSGVKPIATKAYKKILSEHFLLQAEGYILMSKPLGTPFLIAILKSIIYYPSLSIKRKIKAALLLSRIKRTVNRFWTKYK